MTFAAPFTRPFARVFGGVPSAAGGLDYSAWTNYWTLNETTGTRSDSIGGLHYDVIGGTVGYEAGLIGNAATFAATGNFLRRITAPMNFPATGFTVWGWFKFGTPGRTGWRQTGATCYLACWGTNSWRMVVSDSSSGSSTASSTAATTAGAWHFACGRYNPSTKKAEISVDGGAWTLGSALTNGPRSGAAGDIYLNNQGGDGTACSLDEFGYAPVYYADDYVAQLYNGGAGYSPF